MSNKEEQLEFPFINMGYTGCIMSFKNGDRIRIKKTPVIQGTVRSFDSDRNQYMVVMDEDWFGADYYNTDDIEAVPVEPTWIPKCTCGSDHVAAYAGHHSNWCDKFNRS